MPCALLSDTTVAFIEREVAMDLGSCSADGRSSTVRGFACRVAPDRSRLTVFVRRLEARQLLLDVLAQDRVAVVFCLPETEASIQVKGREIGLSVARDADMQAIRDYCARFVDGVARLGYERAFGEAYMAVEAGQMVAVSFTPECVFDQTPGPQAGRQQEGASA